MDINEDRLMTMRRAQDAYSAREQKYICVVSERDELKAEIAMLKKFIDEDCVCPDLYDQYSAPHDEALCNWCIKVKAILEPPVTDEKLYPTPSPFHPERGIDPAGIDYRYPLGDIRRYKSKATYPNDHYARMLVALDATAKKFHPSYGPCDGIADGGACAECERVFDELKAENAKLNRLIQQVKDCWNMAPNLHPE